MAYVSGPVEIGSELRLGLGAKINAPSPLRIGRNVSVGPRSLIEVGGRIEDFCLIASSVLIVGRDDHDYEQVGVPIVDASWVGDRPARDRDRIEIERDVWIGAGATVLSGCRIGTGSIVAAGAVVVRDVPSFTIVAGNPAVQIGRRFQTDEDRARHVKRLDAIIAAERS